MICSICLHNASIPLKQRGNCHCKACKPRPDLYLYQPDKSVTFTPSTLPAIWFPRKVYNPSYGVTFMNQSNREKKKKKKSSVFLGTEKQARKEQIRYVCEESWGGYRTFQSSLFLLRMSLRRVPTLINDSAVICKRENRTTNSSRLCVCSLWPHQHSFLVRQLTWQTI